MSNWVGVEHLPVTNLDNLISPAGVELSRLVKDIPGPYSLIEAAFEAL